MKRFMHELPTLALSAEILTGGEERVRGTLFGMLDGPIFVFPFLTIVSGLKRFVRHAYRARATIFTREYM